MPLCFATSNFQDFHGMVQGQVQGVKGQDRDCVVLSAWLGLMAKGKGYESLIVLYFVVVRILNCGYADFLKEKEKHFELGVSEIITRGSWCGVVWCVALLIDRLIALALLSENKFH